MFGKKNEFPLPELPNLCLACGGRGPFRPVNFEYRYTTAASLLITFLSPALGSVYSQRTAYRPALPVCSVCAAHVRRAKYVAVAAVLLFIPMLVFTTLIILDYSPFFLLTPIAFLVAAYACHGVMRGRGTPKTLRVNKNELALNVPSYGELILFEREPAAGRPAHRQAPKPAQPAPNLKRSICRDCGFINFASAVECKKCRAPLGQAVAAF